jgi:hypothetical protein
VLIEDDEIPIPAPILIITTAASAPLAQVQKGAAGRPSLWGSFSAEGRDAETNVVANVLEEASPKAHRRRQTESIIVGVTIAQIRGELLDKLPWLKDRAPELSETTIRHWFTPPHKGNKAASLYQCLFDARPARGTNDEHDYHINLARFLPLWS